MLICEEFWRRAGELGSKLAALIILKGSPKGMLAIDDPKILIGLNLLVRDDEIPKGDSNGTHTDGD